MKYWNSASYAQGSRLIIVVVQVGAQKIYVTALEAKERQDETEFTTKIARKTKWGPNYFVL